MAHNDKVSVNTLLLVYRKSFPFQSELALALHSGFYLHLYLTVERMDNNLTTQHGRVEIDVEVGVEVVSLPFELRVVFYHEGNVEIAGRCPIGTFSAHDL